MRSTTAPAPLVELSDMDPDTASFAGAKAARLAELSAAGFPVPPGWVLPADHGEPDGPDERGRLAHVLTCLGGPVAVRSSAACEDGADASFAGQFVTVLGVGDLDALHDAVRTCRTSATSMHVDRYASGVGAAGTGAMAVLVQRMVDADVAGVAFTVNPVTGHDEIVVNAVTGIGDRLVGGHVTPQEWVIRDGRARVIGGPDDVLDPTTACAVADLASAVADHYGVPQDIEWAIEAGRLWLLQARPVTTTPEPTDDVTAGTFSPVPPGSWSLSRHTTTPLTTVTSSLVLPFLSSATEDLFAFGVGRGLLFAAIGGRLYTSYCAPESADDARGRAERAARRITDGDHTGIVADWHTVHHPRLRARLDAVRTAPAASTLEGPGLASRITELAELWQETSLAHYRVGGAGTHLLGAFGAFCEQHLGWTSTRALALLAGLPGRTAESGRAFAVLLAEARSRPHVVRELRAGTDPDRLRVADPAFASRLDHYLDQHGRVLTGLELAEPTPAERPELVVRMLCAQLDRHYDPDADCAAIVAERLELTTRAREQLAHSDGDLARFETVLRDARWCYPARDDSQHLRQLAGGLLRECVRAAGVRAVSTGALEHTDEIVHLTLDEIFAVLDGADRRNTARDRAAQHRDAGRHRPPATLGDPPPRPDMSWTAHLSPAAVHVVAAFGWAWREVSGGPTRAARDGGAVEGLVHGVAASGGTYTGIVRVVHNERDFDKVEAGDILVCPETTPQWALLFPLIGALVTDHGGTLSHPAILAREFRIPSVLATGDATTRLRDGDRVTVDGASGTVRVETCSGTEGRR